MHSWHPAAFVFVLFPLRFSSRPCPVSSFLHLSFSFSSTLLRRTARFFPRYSCLLDIHPSERDKKLETLRPNKRERTEELFRGVWDTRFLRGRSPSFFPLSSNVRGKGYVCQSRYSILSNGFYEAYSRINSSRIFYVHVVNILFAHYRDTITFHERVCISSRITRGQTINGEDFRSETSSTRLDPGRPSAVDEKECQSINTSLLFIRIEFRRKTREHEAIHSRRRTCGDGQ